MVRWITGRISNQREEIKCAARWAACFENQGTDDYLLTKRSLKLRLKGLETLRNIHFRWKMMKKWDSSKIASVNKLVQEAVSRAEKILERRHQEKTRSDAPKTDMKKAQKKQAKKENIVFFKKALYFLINLVLFLVPDFLAWVFLFIMIRIKYWTIGINLNHLY